jgi:hypothetical protein
MTRIALLLAVLAGCTDSAEPPDEITDPPRPLPRTELTTETPDPSPDPTPANPTRPEAHVVELEPESGAYDLVSEIDITTSSLLPQTAYQYYDLLRRFRDDPSETIIYLLDEAGIPLVDELFAALPSSLETRVKGWVNEYLQSHVFESGPVADQLNLILEYGEMSLTQVELLTKLDLATTPARHRLVALRFHIGGEAIDVAVPAGAPAPFAFDVTVEASVVGDTLDLGDHAFGVEYGKLAWLAFNEALRRHYGLDLRDTLGLVVDCPALASSVASRCTYGACVGHADEIEAICDAGLDQLVLQMQDKVEAESFDAVHLARGKASIDDDSIERGVWSCEIDMGQGPRSVPATFRGVTSHQ